MLGMRRCIARDPRASRSDVAARRAAKDQKFREPVALSSIEPADFPLPRTALELDFDLIALRALCMEEANRAGCPIKTCRRAKPAICENFLCAPPPDRSI